MAFYDKPFLKFERLLETYSRLRRGASLVQGGDSGLDEREAVSQAAAPEELSRHGPDVDEVKLFFTEHHLSSTRLSAFLSVALREAAILTLDGVGEWATASFALGRGNDWRS